MNNFYIQFVTGTNGQTGHLANRIRVVTKPAPERNELSFGWHVSRTDDEPMTDDQAREVMAKYGIEYPEHIPVLPGDYSVSEPSWNRLYWGWNEQPEEWSPLWSQPFWWQTLHWNELPDNQEILLRDWQKIPEDAITQAEAAEIAGITIQAINQAIRDGRLTKFDNPDAKYRRQGATLVSEAEVRRLWDK